MVTKTIMIISIIVLLIIAAIGIFCIYGHQMPKQLGSNSPSICSSDFVGPLSQSQTKYCEELKNK